jgi:hypothetical protein
MEYILLEIFSRANGPIRRGSLVFFFISFLVFRGIVVSDRLHVWVCGCLFGGGF